MCASVSSRAAAGGGSTRSGPAEFSPVAGLGHMPGRERGTFRSVQVEASGFR